MDGKTSDYSMFNTSNNLNSSGGCHYSVDGNGTSNSFAPANNCNKSQPNADCNVNHYCQNPKFDHLANHWSESMVAMHQQAHQETNYFRNQWHFNGAAANSYHVNDTTIQNIPTSQNQHCLLIPHTHFPHSTSTGKSIWLRIFVSFRDRLPRKVSDMCNSLMELSVQIELQLSIQGVTTVRMTSSYCLRRRSILSLEIRFRIVFGLR